MNINVSQVNVGTSGLNGSSINTSTRFQGAVSRENKGAQENQTSSQHSGTDGQSKGVVAAAAVAAPIKANFVRTTKSGQGLAQQTPEGKNWRKFYMSASNPSLAKFDGRFTSFRTNELFASVKGTVAASSNFANNPSL